jgi:ribosomal-protein-alanine N-acetyltransferase
MINPHIYQQFPVIDLNNNIILRELVNDDAENYFGYMGRSEMLPFLTDNNRPTNIKQAEDELRYWASLFRNQRSIYWGIALKDTDKLIGTAGFNNISKIHSKAEISYDLDPEFWGKGIMLKSIKTIVKFIQQAGVVRIQATVINDNIKSINVLERCGFAKEGLLKKYEIVQGIHRDYYIYAKLD